MKWKDISPGGGVGWCVFTKRITYEDRLTKSCGVESRNLLDILVVVEVGAEKMNYKPLGYLEVPKIHRKMR
jgi:hypothetical protein